LMFNRCLFLFSSPFGFFKTFALSHARGRAVEPPSPGGQKDRAEEAGLRFSPFMKSQILSPSSSPHSSLLPIDQARAFFYEGVASSGRISFALLLRSSFSSSARLSLGQDNVFLVSVPLSFFLPVNGGQVRCDVFP